MVSQLNLSRREMEQAQAYWDIVGDFGKWNQGPFADGAHYFLGTDNPFVDDGMICNNCVFFAPDNGCQIVLGEIDPEGLCKLWIIPDSDLEVW